MPATTSAHDSSRADCASGADGVDHAAAAAVAKPAYLRNVWLATIAASCCSSCAAFSIAAATSARDGCAAGGAGGVDSDGGGATLFANRIRLGDAGPSPLTPAAPIGATNNRNSRLFNMSF